MNRRVCRPSSPRRPRRGLARQPFAHLLSPHLWAPKADGGGAAACWGGVCPPRGQLCSLLSVRKARRRETRSRLSRSFPFSRRSRPCACSLPSCHLLHPGLRAACEHVRLRPLPTLATEQGLSLLRAAASPSICVAFPASRFPPDPGPLCCHLGTGPHPRPTARPCSSISLDAQEAWWRSAHLRLGLLALHLLAPQSPALLIGQPRVLHTCPFCDSSGTLPQPPLSRLPLRRGSGFISSPST